MYRQQTILQPTKVSRKMFCRVFLFEASVTVVTCVDEKLTQFARCVHPTHKQGCEGAQHFLRLLSVSVMPDTLSSNCTIDEIENTLNPPVVARSRQYSARKCSSHLLEENFILCQQIRICLHTPSAHR